MRWLAFVLAATLLTAGVAVAKEDDDERESWARERTRERAELREEFQDKERELREEHRQERQDLREDFREKMREHFLKFHDKWVIQNDDLTIWFHQGQRTKPMLAVFRTGDDGNRSGFKLVLDEFFEAVAMPAEPAQNATGEREDDDEDDDGDGREWKRARGHRLSLHPAREWWTGVGNATDEVTITMSHLFNQGNVSLVFHVPKASGPVKFDVQVQDWDWADPNNTLALRLKVLERGAEQDGDAATFNGGWIRWADSASVTYPDGRSASIPVEGTVQNHGDGARILLRFNGTGGYSMLDYDPVIGVQGMSMHEVPGPGAVVALGVLGLAAAVATRRRRPPA